MRSIQLAEFEKNCLAVLEEVERTGETVTILKQDRPIARLVPPILKREEYPQHSLHGTVEILDDLLEPYPASRGGGGR